MDDLDYMIDLRQAQNLPLNSSEIALEAGVHRSTVYRRLCQRGLLPSTKTTHSLVPQDAPSPNNRLKTNRALTREQFVETFDEDTTARRALETGIASLTDDDEILEDAEFRRGRCGACNVVRFNAIAAEEQYRPYQVVVGKGKRYWSTPDTVQYLIGRVSKAQSA